MTQHTFPQPMAAAAAIMTHSTQSETLNQYEIEAVYDGGDRVLVGFQVRVKDLDGFGVGRLNELGELVSTGGR